MVLELQKHMRVDSLGKCIHTPTRAEGISLSSALGQSTALEVLQAKRKAIAHYQFYLAFENSYERGYVTEKVFDALIAGIVPVIQL
jgi:glycoprotein 3-alpha-L-fucosyltransferase